MDSEYSEKDASSQEDPPQDVKRGRPVGKTDQKPRYRRTAQQISDDKIKAVQMKLDALRENEEKKLANKKSRPPRAKAASIKESALPAAPKPVVREAQRPESPPPKPVWNRRQQLYDSRFPSSPRTRNF